MPAPHHVDEILARRRLRWIGPKVSAEKAHVLLQPAIPPQNRYPMHVLLIDHGRKTCKAIAPACHRCVLLDLCPCGKARTKPRKARA
jgi:endonuclease-3